MATWYSGKKAEERLNHLQPIRGAPARPNSADNTCCSTVGEGGANAAARPTWKREAGGLSSPVLVRHLDISRESRRNFQFKMTRKILTAVVQRLAHLVSLDISGHIMLDNCTVPHFEEAMGRPRWVTVVTVGSQTL